MSKLYLKTDLQIYKLYAYYAHEVDVKNGISHCAKREKIQGVRQIGVEGELHFEYPCLQQM